MLTIDLEKTTKNIEPPRNPHVSLPWRGSNDHAARDRGEGQGLSGLGGFH